MNENITIECKWHTFKSSIYEIVENVAPQKLMVASHKTKCLFILSQNRK